MVCWQSDVITKLMFYTLDSSSFSLDELFVRPQERPVDPTRPFVRSAFLSEINGNSAARRRELESLPLSVPSR